MSFKRGLRLACVLVASVAVPTFVLGANSDSGIPVSDPLLKSKCGACHESDQDGNMQRVSWERASPDGWQEALKRMQLLYDVELTSSEFDHLVHYLSGSHGLAPEETGFIRADLERRIKEETDVPDSFSRACGRCHRLSRVLAWRRSEKDWREVAERHAIRYNVPVSETNLAYLNKVAPLHSPEWESWNSKANRTTPEGTWFVTASIAGRGTYLGRMEVSRDSSGGPYEYLLRADLQSVRNGTTINRSGRFTAYGGYSWSGSSKATAAPGTADSLASESTDVFWMASNEKEFEGRMFWGQYQEFGIDVKARRATNQPVLAAIDRTALKIGTNGNRIRLFGANFPKQVSIADITLGAGLSIRSILSNSPTELALEIDVAPEIVPGRREISAFGSILPSGIALYDAIDYLVVTPESSVASYGDQNRNPGYQIFEAIGYHRGPDGKRHTADDFAIGPVDVNWSLKVFYEAEGKSDFVGSINSEGLFTPAPISPKNNFDVWAIATAADQHDRNGNVLSGKGYLVVTVPFYTFRGRRYVRDLGGWIDDGPAEREAQ